jgi:hypothetical protein
MDNDLDIDYLITCAKMTLEGRFLKGLELSEWAKNLNSLYMEQFQQDLNEGSGL